MSNYTQCLPSNPDISGIGVRTAVYAQNLLSFIPALFALHDKKVTPLELDSLETQSTTILITAFAILLSVIVQGLKHSLTNYHAAIILNLSWMNNTNLFIYFLLYAYHIIELQDEDKKQHPRHSFWTKLRQTVKTKKAWKNPVFIIGSLHLSVMSAVGLWVWKQPVAFGDSHPCSLSASLVVVGQTVPIGSEVLQIWSLLIYSRMITPVLNMIIPITFFAALIWVYSQFVDTFTLNRDAAVKLTGTGLAILAVINILLVADTEVAISKNKALTVDDGDTEWTFGQTLALLLLLIPIRDITEALSERQAKRLGKKLMAAAEKGELHSVQDAIKSGAAKTAIYDTLRCAVRNEHWDIVKILADIDVDARDTQGRTMLHYGAITGSLEILKQFLNLNADVNAKDNSGEVPLHKAATHGHCELVKLLIEFKADINAKDEDNNTPLHNAALGGSLEVVKLLIDIKVDVNAKGRHNLTAFSFAAFAGRFEVVKFLVEHGAEIDPRALKWAAGQGHPEVVRYLIELSGDVNAKNDKGSTLLHYTAKHGQLETVKLLIELKADANIKNNHGKTALDLAAHSKHTEVVNFLSGLD